MEIQIFIFKQNYKMVDNYNNDNIYQYKNNGYITENGMQKNNLYIMPRRIYDTWFVQ